MKERNHFFSSVANQKGVQENKSKPFKKCFNRISKAVWIILRWNAKEIKRDIVSTIRKGLPLLCKKEKENMKKRRKTQR